MKHAMVAQTAIRAVRRKLERDVVLVVQPLQQQRAAQQLPSGKLFTTFCDIFDA